MQTQMNYAVAYNEFLITEAYNQTVMSDCINKAIHLAEGTMTTEVLTEGFTDKIKEMWNKFVTFINKIWHKFKEGFDKILDNDRGYLKKYQAIITQRKVKITELSMPNYQAKIIAATHAEQLNPSKIDDMLGGMSSYLGSMQIPEAIKNYKGEETSQALKTGIETAFCGGSLDDKDYNVSSLNMTDLYDYCYDFKEKTLPDINRDFDAITKSATNFKRLCDELDASNKKVEADITQEKEDARGEIRKKSELVKDRREAITGGVPVSTDPNATAGSNSVLRYYSGFMKLNEVNIGGNSKPDGSGAENKAGAAGGVSVNADSKFSKNASGLSGKEANRDDVANAKATTTSGFTSDDIDKAIKTYENVNMAIISAKQTICEKMYKDYMSIIRWHVRSYVGETGGKVAGASGTDYSQGQNNQQSQGEQ